MIGEEVQTSKGLKRFFVLFCIFALGGVFTNKFIQKTVQAHWMGVNEAMLKEGVVMAPPRVVFARYGLPTFGAWIDTISWQKPEDCRTLRVLAKDIFVPIPFIDILISRPRAGAISVSQLIVEHQAESSCQKGPLPISDELKLPDVPIVETASKSRHAENLQKNIDVVRKWRKKLPFSKLHIKNIELKNIFLSGKTISGHGESTAVVDDVLQAEFEFRPLVLQKEKKSIATKLEIAVLVSDDDVKGKVDWSYDEGHLLWTSELNKENILQTQFSLSNLPLSVVNRWLGTPWTFQFLWANCQLGLKAPLKNIDDEKWVASDCSVKGPQGEVEITNVDVLSLLKPTNLKVDVLFKDFKVDGVIKGVSELPLAGVFKKFGTVTGGIYFRDRETTSALNIKNAEVLFSKNNKRTLQEIENLDVSASYVQKKWNVVLSKAVLKDGQFAGAISAQYDKAAQLWQGRLNIQALAFSPQVQEIMLGGKISPLKVQGDIVVGHPAVVKKLDLRGDFSEASMEGITISDGVFFLDRNDEGVRLGMSLAQVEIPRGPNSDWFFVSLLDRALITEKIVISRLHSEAVLNSGKLFIRKISGSGLNGKVTLTGEYTSSLQEGTLEWNLPKYSYQWEWLREGGQVTLFPGSDSMREWLRINQDFSKEFQGVRILSQKETKGN